ncbi:hypothetical protein [Lactococcus cremoris]|uniref:Uncharacterized protein n=1 Tax=Lactococcus cremoris subsp. cremoris GE214 TaxID=1415168 RepID=A0A084A8T0_LACLC|nr:hypothetical protein [Lactococcus cremoris]KEY61709.1 hypothetical protein U725_02151 [Lactococcus cremoris subsp. cremoris GE214]
MAYLKKILKLSFGLSPIAVVISAYLLAGFYKFKIPFIDEGSLGEFNVALYSAILMLLVNLLQHLLTPSTSIELEFSSQKGVYNNIDMISCPFNSDIATVYFFIKLTGNPKKLQDKKLKLLLPPDVTAQSLPDFSGFYSLDNDGSSLEVYMSKFFNNNRSTFLEKEGKEIAFNVIKSREDINGLISSELNKERRVSFKANKLRLTR